MIAKINAVYRLATDNANPRVTAARMVCNRKGLEGDSEQWMVELIGIEPTTS